eukprot:2124455-Rhodomonas_salina.1
MGEAEGGDGGERGVGETDTAPSSLSQAQSDQGASDDPYFLTQACKGVCLLEIGSQGRQEPMPRPHNQSGVALFQW